MGIFFLLQTFTKKKFNFAIKLGCMQNDELRPIPSFVQMVDVPCVADERGSLCFVENGEFPFKIERVFWIYGVGEGMTRGCHAHNTCSEVVFPVSGSFDIDIDDGKHTVTCHMDCPNRGVLIPAKVWCNLKNFAEGTVCVVLASHKYEADGYINDYETFKQMYG